MRTCCSQAPWGQGPAASSKYRTLRRGAQNGPQATKRDDHCQKRCQMARSEMCDKLTQSQWKHTICHYLLYIQHAILKPFCGPKYVKEVLNYNGQLYEHNNVQWLWSWAKCPGYGTKRSVFWHSSWEKIFTWEAQILLGSIYDSFSPKNKTTPKEKQLHLHAN